MRPKFVITLFLGAVLVLALALLAKLQFSKTAPKETASSAAPAESTLPPLPPLPAPVVQASAPVNSNPAPVAGLSQDDRDAKIGAELMRINAVIGKNDSNSVALLMSDLTNDEQEVRDQAVAAMKQLSDRSVIPALTNLAANTEDYEQRHAILDAANFLALPTLTEVQQTMTPSDTPLPKPVQHPHGGRTSNRQAGQQGNTQQAAPVDPNAADPNAMQ